MEMPGQDYFGPGLAQAVNSSQVSLARLDDMVTRILTVLYSVGAMNSSAPVGLFIIIVIND